MKNNKVMKHETEKALGNCRCGEKGILADEKEESAGGGRGYCSHWRYYTSFEETKRQSLPLLTLVLSEPTSKQGSPRTLMTASA